jgi:hypothetical protein
MRWGAGDSGKRGGVRMIYLWDRLPEVIYLLLVYAKSVHDDLTPTQLRILRKVV